MDLKISVCIPTYNRRDLLRQTLESVFAQTYRNFEVHIVDDGSTDGTDEMIKREFPQIKYHYQANAGDASSRNKLIELAQTQYITFIDSDDLLFADSIERMYAAMQKHGGNVIVYGAYLGIDENGQTTGKCKRTLRSGKITQYLFDDILIHSCGSMFPRKAILDEGGFDTSLRVCSDYDLWLRLSLKYEFIALDEPTFKRRRHGGNLSAISLKNRLAELAVLEKFYYEKGGRDFVPQAVALKRLSREAYRAAKAAVNEKNTVKAREFFDKSLKYRFSFKSLYGKLKTAL